MMAPANPWRSKVTLANLEQLVESHVPQVAGLRKSVGIDDTAGDSMGSIVIETDRLPGTKNGPNLEVRYAIPINSSAAVRWASKMISSTWV
jgi:hypothetical protein